MADIHIAESVIEVNHADYRTDSAKQLMKQSVLQRHGVTQQQLDTSFNWYGHNITVYMEVYDKTIEILEHRIAETGNRIAAENISVAGDSVDVWPNYPAFAVNSLSPTKFLTFALTADDNWERGDIYTWRAKFTNNQLPSAWAIAVRYSDGSSEFIASDLSGDGWQELLFVTDSTKTAESVYGYMNINPRQSSTLYADSIMLVRNRVESGRYVQHYRQRKFVPENTVDNDSTDISE